MKAPLTFRHGVHPPESKAETQGLPIRQFPFAPVLVVPLVQHLGKPSVPEVREGQEVTRGQRLARPDGFMSVSMHAPASGVVRRIALAPHLVMSIMAIMLASIWTGSAGLAGMTRRLPIMKMPSMITASAWPAARSIWTRIFVSNTRRAARYWAWRDNTTITERGVSERSSSTACAPKSDKWCQFWPYWA